MRAPDKTQVPRAHRRRFLARDDFSILGPTPRPGRGASAGATGGGPQRLQVSRIVGVKAQIVGEHGDRGVGAHKRMTIVVNYSNDLTLEHGKNVPAGSNTR